MVGDVSDTTAACDDESLLYSESTSAVSVNIRGVPKSASFAGP